MYSKLWVDIHVKDILGAYCQGGLNIEDNVLRLVEFDCKRNLKHQAKSLQKQTPVVHGPVFTRSGGWGGHVGVCSEFYSSLLDLQWKSKGGD